VYRRWPVIAPFEIGCYWAAVTLAAVFAFDRNSIYGGTWGAGQLTVFAFTTGVAGLLAYWRNRPMLAAAGHTGLAVWRNPGARIGLIIAVLVLALILIFWVFASPPAQASAGTNFNASPLMQ
jgi:hypothetical protein